ncbi:MULTISPECIES: PAS domain-containing protein [Methanosarcina]|uniref:histidine kinase n=4 Tax=Methanosarcina barkeri TaxID=2208 RepID=A0A0G3CAI2_METBA|nr:MULTISPECIES: PAS domain-containing protein [Methanosarcina]AKJ37655.1 PAS domain-containing protein [Methanosarcina barkeri CM1]
MVIGEVEAMGFNQLAESDELILGEALERQQVLETVINNSPVMAFLWAPDKKWPAKYVSENVTQLEYSAEDFLTGRIIYSDIVHSEDIDRVRKELTRCCEAGNDSFVQRYRVLTGKREIRWVEEKTFIQRDKTGNVTNFQGIVRDITQEIKNEKALKDALQSQKALMEKQKALLERQKVLEAVINNSPMVVFLWKAEKYWPTLYVSENVRQFGYVPEDFISGKVLYGKIIHPEDLLLVELELEENCEEGGKEFNRQYRILTQTADVRWIDEKTFIQRNEEGKVTHFQGIIEDITRSMKRA